MTGSAGSGVGVLVIVENLPVPFDRRVWQEATALRDAGFTVSVICPKGRGYEKSRDLLDGIQIYRHGMPKEADGAWGYILEYSAALLHESRLAWWVLLRRGFTVIHACNPPDLLFLVAIPFKLLGKKFLFDHHDIAPELYEAKFGHRGFWYRWLLRVERWTFALADVSIATNESYREIAINRGRMAADRVFVVRSGPDLTRLRVGPPVAELRHGKRYLVGYVGVIGTQEGIDLLLRAVHYLVHERDRHDIHFGIVGGGTEVERLKRLATELGLNHYVTFVGRVSDEEMLRWLNTADVCVNPDVANPMNDYSTMNKILEYMALGKPVVQFDLREGRVSAGASSLYPEETTGEISPTRSLN